MKITAQPLLRSRHKVYNLFDDKLERTSIRSLPGGGVSFGVTLPSVNSPKARYAYTIALSEEEIEKLVLAPRSGL